jgi:hypothetical protein
MAIHWNEPPRRPQGNRNRAAYTLVVRGPDGRLRYERFDDAPSYRARLISLQRSNANSVAIDDILPLLDV